MQSSDSQAETPSSPPTESPSPHRLEVSVARQRLRVFEEGKLIREYPISTSKYGLGTEEGSNRTPLGRFRISEKHGCEAPLYTQFVGREPVGEWTPGEPVEEDMVLTRILWLDGSDAENANTKERYIYIHGTNQEELIGQPASHGCIRMKNADVSELHDLVDVGANVKIGA